MVLSMERRAAKGALGPPDGSRNQRLDALLRAHPELQADYLDHLQLHAMLQWRAGKVPQAATQIADKAIAQPVSHAQARWRSGSLHHRFPESFSSRQHH